MINKTFILLFFVTVCHSCTTKSNPNPSGNGNNPGSNNPPPGKEVSINWDQSTLTKISQATSGSGYSGYARIIQLKDGSLICVYEADGNIVAVKSENKGITWSDTTVVAPKISGINMATPDVLALADGSLLVAYNPRPLEPFSTSKSSTNS